MYVIIIFDPDTCEFKEVVGPFDTARRARVFADLYKLENIIIAELKSPFGRGLL